MAVHSFHVFDRKGKTLFTKRYARPDVSNPTEDQEQLSEQRKLVFGMIFSLREITKMLAPSEKAAASGLHSVQTGKATLYNYETSSGLRFCLYCSNPTTTATTSSSAQDASHSSSSVANNQQHAAKIRAALAHIYNELWIQCVTRSPLYTPTQPNVPDTNFEATLDAFLKAQPWYSGNSIHSMNSSTVGA